MVSLKAYTLSFFILFLGFAASTQAQSLSHFFDQADAFLSSNIKNGKVPYQSIKQNPQALNKLVDQIGHISLKSANKSQKKAFYIDAYNLLVIHSIIKHGIPSSPQDVDGFFESIKHSVAGQQLTLNDIEDNKLHKGHKDPRIHFALVCGAMSCPPIRSFAYKPDKLDEQLTQVTRTTLNSDFIRVNKSQKAAEISMIFKWYKQAFLNHADSVRAFINKYRKQEIPANYHLKFYDYDWSLNKQ